MFANVCVRFGVFAVASLLCSLPAQAQNKTKYGVNKALGDTYVAAKSVADGQARLVIYRAPVRADQSDLNPGVISVYINNRYHASLQKEAFSVVCLSGKQADIRTRHLADQGADIRAELDTSQTLPLNPGQSVYLRVAHSASQKSRMDIVPAQTATAELAEAKQQMHTLSRVPAVQPCREAEPSRQVFDPKVITLGLQALFEPQKTDISGMRPESRDELKAMVQKVNVKYKTLTDVKVHVVGFAHDATDEAINQHLSLERAKAVRAYLTREGLRTTAFTFEGRGSQDKQKTKDLGVPLSRVEVEVSMAIN